MATGRLASGSIAAGGATQLYRNSTGNPQVITLLASSQVSGKAPKLNVKITNENIASSVTVSQTTLTTNHTLDANYPAAGALTAVAGGTGTITHLSLGKKYTSKMMGQSYSHYGTSSSYRSYPASPTAFDQQPSLDGSNATTNWSGTNNNFAYARCWLPTYDPYYFENPNYFNQKKARGIVFNNSSASSITHCDDITLIPFNTLQKYYNCKSDAASDYMLHSTPVSGTDGVASGLTTQNWSPSYYIRGNIYDPWTGLWFGQDSNSYTTVKWWDENSISTANSNDESSGCGINVWSTMFSGQDPRSHDTYGRGSSFHTPFDMERGLIVFTARNRQSNLSFKFLGRIFGNDANSSTTGTSTIDDKDNRAITHAIGSVQNATYYHLLSYQGNSNRELKLQWVKYNKTNDKYYICLRDNSGSISSTLPTAGTSYSSENGIFELDMSLIYGYNEGAGNGVQHSIASSISAGFLTKKGSIPDTTTDCMMKPLLLAPNLWVSLGGDGKQYFSNNLYTWAEKSSTYIPDAYDMSNANASDVKYHIASGSKSVLASITENVTNDVYDQAAAAGIIAKGAVTPYEQKSIILSDGDAIYVENEDATNAISITAMGVDV